MNRLRAKIDKEIENKDIRKKLKNVQARVHSNLLSNTNQFNNDKSGNMTAKISARRAAGGAVRSNSERRAATLLSPTKLQLEQSGQRHSPYDDSNVYIRNVHIMKPPLSMYMTSSFNQKQSRLNKNAKDAKAKTFILPAISDNEPNEFEDHEKMSRSMKSLDINLTPHSVNSSPSVSIGDAPSRNSPQHTAKMTARSTATNPDCLPSPTTLDMVSLSSGSTTYLNLDLDLCSLSSPKSCEEVFHMAPLLPAPSAALSDEQQRTSNDTSAALVRGFRNVLEREDRFMPESDINVVKNVLKTDERVSLLKCQEPDSRFFKDVLKTQLDEIVKSEKVVKTALRMLGSTPPSAHRFDIPSPIQVYDVTPMQRQKGKFKPKPIQYSTDSSPRNQSSMEFKDLSSSKTGKRIRHIATDTFSINGYTSRNEIFKAYNEKNSAKKAPSSKPVVATPAPNGEFEAFVKNTLPLKRKTTAMKKESSHHIVRRQSQSNDDLEVNLVRNQSGVLIDISPTKESRKPQVDVTFKNVPSVEKEILILKALGKRLEETLKRTNSEPQLSDKSDAEELQTCSSDSSLTRELQKIDPSIAVFPGRRGDARLTVTPLHIAMTTTPWHTGSVGFAVYSKGVRLQLGVVNEFVIISKTVNELLSESSREYFIANDNEPGGLNPIPFQQLAEQPQALMHYLKPKNPLMPFNILDQDSVFFNSFLLPGLKSKISVRAPQKKSNDVSRAALEEPPKITEGGDSLMVAKDALPIIPKESEVPSCSKFATDTQSNASQKLRSKKKPSKPKPTPPAPPMECAMPQRIHQRGRIHRIVTPLPPNAYDDPKNHLIKTVLVGAVQVSIFLLMIMAITFPDIKC